MRLGMLSKPTRRSLRADKRVHVTWDAVVCAQTLSDHAPIELSA